MEDNPGAHWLEFIGKLFGSSVVARCFPPHKRSLEFEAAGQQLVGPMSKLSLNPTPLNSVSPPEDNPRRGVVSSGMAWLLIAAVKLYRVTLQFWLGGHCRFEPSCSQYFIEAVRKYGPLRGAVKGVWRICRCQPFCRGGDDPP